MSRCRAISALLLACCLASATSACVGGINSSAEEVSESDDTGGNPPVWDGGTPPDAPGINWDAFFAKDPPPKYCGPGGSKPPKLPGGTPDCPDDKNREGCPCKKKGETASCWPGLRVNRNRGQCKDGVTTCQLKGELHLSWGPCKGYVLPTAGATFGPAACTCFSQGMWNLANLTFCPLTYPNGNNYMVSTLVDSSGNPVCPWKYMPPEPPTKPSQTWTPSTLKVDCEGEFRLCITLRAGQYAKPSTSDCMVARVCTTKIWYGKKNTTQTLPALPSWSSNNSACAKKFIDQGGYGEMSVTGQSIECQKINLGNTPRVFARFGYCPYICATKPSLPQCKICTKGGSGSF